MTTIPALNIRPTKAARKYVNLTKTCCGTTFTADSLAQARDAHSRYHNTQYSLGTRTTRCCEGPGCDGAACCTTVVRTATGRLVAHTCTAHRPMTR